MYRHAIPKMDEDKVKEKRERKDRNLLKRELPTPKDCWLEKNMPSFIQIVMDNACSNTL